MLGASLGELPDAMDCLKKWYSLAKYDPILYKDTELDEFIPVEKGVGEQEGCLVWNGPNGPVIVQKSDGTKTYAMHDLMFAKKVAPTHYVTAIEQQEHFASLGLKDRHLPMGLVLGEDGKKIKSRSGDALFAEEALQLVKRSLKDGTEELAWNVLAWNFLSVGRSQNVKFIPSLWANPDRGGLYISYTYARVKSALKAAGYEDPVGFEPHPQYEPQDVLLMGYAAYYSFYSKRAIEEMDSCPVAQYAFDLAKKLGKVMEQRRVVGGSFSFKSALWRCMTTLGWCMKHLTMNVLDQM
jgi:arginyl-tRNA synthetase